MLLSVWHEKETIILELVQFLRLVMLLKAASQEIVLVSCCKPEVGYLMYKKGNILSALGRKSIKNVTFQTIQSRSNS